MKGFPKVFLKEEKEEDIKTWVLRTLASFEGLPITRSTRDLILAKYEEFKQLLNKESLISFLENDLHYNEVEWELHDMLVKVVKNFSKILNALNKELDDNYCSVTKFIARDKINKFDSSYFKEDKNEEL